MLLFLSVLLHYCSFLFWKCELGSGNYATKVKNSTFKIISSKMNVRFIFFRKKTQISLRFSVTLGGGEWYRYHITQSISKLSKVT